MIDVGDGRGKERSELGKKNRELIIDYFTKNPGATKIQCAKDLNISKVTVMRHVKAINGE